MLPHQSSLAQALKAQDYDTAFLIAAGLGNSNLIRQLLEKPGLNRHCVDGQRNIALHIAAQYGKTETCQTLLKAGLYINFMNLADNTPLGVAVANCQYATASFLLNQGALPFIHPNNLSYG